MRDKICRLVRFAVQRVGSRLVGTLSLLRGDGDAAVDRRSCVIVWRSPEPCLADRQAKGA
jgi:hypothetical protein